MDSIALQRVTSIPRELASGILYVSNEYAVAVHLCACGCGQKVTTPLGPAEWTFSERDGRPSLHPSIGNWQLPCRSHYVIGNGKIHWAGKWSDVQVRAGRNAEEQRRQAHYASLDRERGFWRRVWKFIGNLFGR